MASTKLDVAILGGGMVGNLLARQLSLDLPGKRIAVFERKAEYTYNIGESSVEIASNYFIRRLKLSSYMYDRHTPKNGLRFFFDSENKNTPLHEMSEIGSTGLPYFPAFQIDRSRLEADLAEMNARTGIEMHLGTRVEDLELGEGGASHRFRAVSERGTEEYESRWVVDATGRHRMIARQKDLHIPETQLTNASIWCWFEGVADIDALDPEEFRARINYSARKLSTVHFLYRGYWIWFIPLREGVTSVGVVCEKKYYDRKYCTKEGFLEFLRQHKAVASLIENVKPIEVQDFPQLAYGVKQFYSENRWGLVGESSAFPDPYYSPGADFISLGNCFIGDLIVRDFNGEGEPQLFKRLNLYNDFMHFRVGAALQIYTDQYSVFGSYEVNKLKWDFDIGCYYNLWVSAFLHDEHLDERELERQLASKDAVLAALGNFARLFRKVDDHLTAQGQYYRLNRGQFSNGQDCLGFAMSVTKKRSTKEVLKKTEEIFNTVHHRALDLLEDAKSAKPREAKPLSWFMAPKDLAQA